MTGHVWAVDAVSAAPEYSGRMLRATGSPRYFGATAARPLGGRSGVRYGTDATTVETSAFTWTIHPHSGMLDLQAADEASCYEYAFDADETGTIDAAHATLARIDILTVLLDDPAESDGSTDPAVSIVYTAGTASGSPAAPATPSRSMVLATISVPASGGGNPTASWAAPYAVAAGAIIPVRTTTERAALYSAYPPSTEAVTLTARKDATAGRWLEGSSDGTNVYYADMILAGRTPVKAYYVADTTARTTLASAFSPTASNPLITYRGDATRGRELEITEDGSSFRVLSVDVGSTLVRPTSVSAASGTATATDGLVTFTTASTVSVNGCFTSAFSNYLIKLTTTAHSPTSDVLMRLRLAGADALGANTYGTQRTHANGTTVATSNFNSTSWVVLPVPASTIRSGAAIHLYSPGVAVSTIGHVEGTTAVSTSGMYQNTYGFYHSTATAYDGFTIYPSSAGTITGTLSVYGYNVA